MLRYGNTKRELLEFRINNKIISHVIFSCGIGTAPQAAQEVKAQGLDQGLLNTDVTGARRKNGRMEYYILDILGGDIDKNSNNVKFNYWARLGGIASRLAMTLLFQVRQVVPQDRSRSFLTAYYDAEISDYDYLAENEGEKLMENLKTNMEGFQAEQGKGLVSFTIDNSAKIINRKVSKVIQQIQTQ